MDRRGFNRQAGALARFFAHSDDLHTAWDRLAWTIPGKKGIASAWPIR